MGRFRLKGIPIVGKTTLYTFLHEDKALGGDLYQLTRHHLKYRRKSLAKPLKSQWEKRKGINQRAECIHQEERFGDFEMDLIIGAKQQEAILTLTDRKTDYAILEPFPKEKNSKALARVVNQKLNYFKRMGIATFYHNGQWYRFYGFFFHRKSAQNSHFLCKALLFNRQTTHRTSKQIHKTIYTERNLVLRNIEITNQNNTKPAKQQTQKKAKLSISYRSP